MEKQCFFDGNGNPLSLRATVKAFGAAGNGLHDDTSAIQSALNAKKEGGTVYFPAGTYKITQPVFFYSNQTLIFEGGATLLQGASMDNLMMNYSTADKGNYDATDNVIIRGATFDGGSYSQMGDYPAWEYRKESALRDTMVKTYVDMFGKEPLVLAIHAGLECGLLGEKIPGLDAVSIGPNMHDIHTSRERLEIASTARMWEFLKAVLKAM